MSSDPRLESPAAARNREHIRERLAPLLPEGRGVLEIASGTGEHCVHFALRAVGVHFQPSDPDPNHRASIDAWARHLDLDNVAPALELDVAQDGWWRALDAQDVGLVYCANMIHIAPWAAALGLLRGAGALLGEGERLVLYGPFLRADVETAPSNLAFDESLRARDPGWGIRALEDVEAAAAEHGLVRESVHDMPANNLLVVFSKRAG